MNIFIIPDGDRHRCADLIYHHNKIGNRVFLPVFGLENSVDWKRCAAWPGYLTYNSKFKDKINYEIYGINDESNHIGEDFFLKLEKIEKSLSSNLITCDFIDPLKTDIRIDIIHFLLDGGSSTDQMRRNYIKKICDKHQSKVISSAMVPFRGGNYEYENSLIGIPSICELREYKNKFSMFPSDYEFKILGVNLNTKQNRLGFASFNHNFQDRHPDDFKFQENVNILLPQNLKIQNFGGNTRQVGADIRECSKNHGKYVTLSPREALKKILSLYCVVLFKETDWGSGVTWNTFISGTPVIVRSDYYHKKTNLNKYMQDRKHCIVVSTPQEAAKELLEFNDDKFEFYYNNIKNLYNSYVNDEYFKQFKHFIDNVN